MNEFQKAQEEDDLKALRELEPSWKNARVEPLIAPADSDVKVPQWGKTILPIENKGDSDGESNDFQLVTVIAGRENGSTFTPCLVSVIGPFVDL